MFERVKRGGRLFTEAWAILAREKSLALYPLVAAMIILAVLALLFFPVLFFVHTTGIDPAAMGITGWILWVVVLFAILLVVSLIATIFKAGIVHGATRVIRGENTTFGGGMGAAAAHIGPLCAWAVIQATIGLVLSLVRETDNPLGRMVTDILVGIAGAMWALATFFVVPVILFEEKGAIPSIKESWGLFKQTWGETVVSGFSFALLYIPAILCLLAAVATLALAPFEVFAGMLVVTVILFAITGVVASAIHGILVAVLYRYAQTGELPSHMDRESIEGAFVEQRQRKATGARSNI